MLAEADIVGDRLSRPVRKARRSDKFIAEVAALGEGDLVVHRDHGIGRFDGLITLSLAGAPHDCLRLIYQSGDKLFVPVEHLDVLSRYGAADGTVQLDKLGGLGWQARKAKVKKRIREIAGELIEIAARRAMRKGAMIAPPPGLYEEFAARFAYDETEDQERAIEAVLDDLAAGHPMDRLICGDVGFGKTEVALRAAFVVAMAGKQVAILAPTTLLVRQHFQVMRERFAGLPLRIEQVSRFVPAKQVAEIRDGLAKGDVDIVVGTHALLGDKVRFRDLGLVVVDEEQHFGVAHKEKLKQLRAEVHMLAMTATPIPRTLQMALGGLKELSIIATPPVDRLAVRAFVLPTDPVVLREAILREHYRGGQTFYVCPRIEDQGKLAEQLRELVPEVKLAVANGRLPARQLEDVMTAFYDRQIDLLVTTNIIESGLDVPTANTLIVHRSDRFGLSQLYQLRGRIGRGKVRGYAYFTLPPKQKLREAAERRLHVIQSLDELGAGFQLASHDLDIRGAGNLLGEEQSGHIREVGFELYNHLLEEAVMLARKEERRWRLRGGGGLVAADHDRRRRPDSRELHRGHRPAPADVPPPGGARIAGRHRGVRRRADRPLRPAAGRDRAAAAAGRDQAAVQARGRRQGRGRPEGRAARVPRQQVRAARSAWSASSPSTPRPCGCAPTTAWWSAARPRARPTASSACAAWSRSSPSSRRDRVLALRARARQAYARARGTDMAKVLERSQARYDTDLLAWAERQAAHLRAGQLDRLDVEHLIEELEAMAGKLRRELKNRLRVLLAHLLKWQAQPKRRSRSWAATIAEQRDQIEALLEENPSLRQDLDEVARSVYPRAVRLAAIETGLPRHAFPPELPYAAAQILGDDLADAGDLTLAACGDCA